MQAETVRTECKVLTHGKMYSASLKLNAMQMLAPNTLVNEEIRKIGFKNVIVSGLGSTRKAMGVWNRETIAIMELLEKENASSDLLKQIIELKEL